MCRLDNPAEFVDYWGQPVLNQLVRLDGTFWRWKRGDGWREILASKLGAGLVNIAQAVTSTGVGTVTLLDGTQIDVASAPGSSLVRVIQCYEPAEFPDSDLELALAGELVFSAWVRRRDMHSWNRAYVDGVPGFFDHHAAFDAEPENDDLTAFFRAGDNAGYAGNLRMGRLPDAHEPTTMSDRIPEHRPLAVIRVRDAGKFEAGLDWTTDQIGAISDERIRILAHEAGVPDPNRIADHLGRWRADLPEAVRRLKAILRS